MDWASYAIQLALALTSLLTLAFYVYQYKTETKKKKDMEIHDLSVKIRRLIKSCFEYSKCDLAYHAVKHEIYCSAEERISNCIGQRARYNEELGDKARELREKLRNYQIDFDYRREMPIGYRNFINAIEELQDISDNELYEYPTAGNKLREYCKELQDFEENCKKLVSDMAEPALIERLSKTINSNSGECKNPTKKETNSCISNIDKMIRDIISERENSTKNDIDNLNDKLIDLNKFFTDFPHTYKSKDARK